MAVIWDYFLAVRPPHSPTPVRVLTVSGAAGAKANYCRFTQPLWDGCGKKSVVDLDFRQKSRLSSRRQTWPASGPSLNSSYPQTGSRLWTETPKCSKSISLTSLTKRGSSRSAHFRRLRPKGNFFTAFINWCTDLRDEELPPIKGPDSVQKSPDVRPERISLRERRGSIDSQHFILVLGSKFVIFAG
jgi:hypothetical protein